MYLILSILLILAIFLKFFPPKKPNYFFGYQLGSSKKSLQHWKLANNYAANYMIILYSILIVLSLIFDYYRYENSLLIISIFITGFIIIYFQIERKLRVKIN